MGAGRLTLKNFRFKPRPDARELIYVGRREAVKSPYNL